MDELTEQIREKAKTKKQTEKIKFFKTGCTLFDLALGGGFAQGRMVNIIGDKSTGKTLITLEAIASNKRDNPDIDVYYDDAEAGFNFNSEELFGVTIYDENFSHSKTIEDFDLNFSKITKKNNQMIYVLDSFDAIGSEDESEKREENRKKREAGKKEKGDYGMSKQKKSGQFFRDYIQDIRKQNSTLIIISQVRENIGVSFGAKHTRSGGKALDFYASQMIWLAECEKMKKRDIPIGIRTKIRVTKNKVGKPFRECYIDILFDYGIDNVMSNLNFLYDLLTDRGCEKLKREKLKWDDIEYTKSALIKHIEDNNLEDELDKRVIKKWNEREEAICPNHRKRKH